MVHEDIDLESVESRKALIESLVQRCSWNHPVGDIRVLDTHISWVLLTGEYAYKIKKPIRLEFLDYSSLEQRKRFCEIEVELNRRWAPDIYLDVVPVCGSIDAPVVGGAGTPIEYMVKMKQFPQSAQLDAQLAAGLLSVADMIELAGTVAGMHAAIPVCDELSADDWLATTREAMFDNFDYLEDDACADDVRKLQSWTRHVLDDYRQLMLDRYRGGFVRDCHGDLYLKNLVRLPSGIVPYDCVDFSTELRRIDVISDISFLVMDLLARDEQQLAYAFVNRYLECTGDYKGISLLGPYFVYHALIRAKIAAISAVEKASDAGRQKDREEMLHYCGIARRWIDSAAPRLIIMHGYSGSGKTCLSQQLMLQLPAIRIRSDVERKRLQGLAETQRSDSPVAEGLYAPDVRARVYEHLATLTESLLTAGHNVIVDAAFLARTERDQFRDLADRAGFKSLIVSASAARKELQRRVEQRTAAGSDPSEADIAVLRYQFEHADAFGSDERDSVVEVMTDRPVNIDEIVSELLSD